MIEEKISKVAICPLCDGFVLACHVNYLSKPTEKEFTALTNKGFIIKIETGDETRSRELKFCDKGYIGKCNECGN